MAGELLFYFADDGAIATARLNTEGGFSNLKDGKIRKDWTTIVGVS